MTIGYGGAMEQKRRPVFAKIKFSGRSHSGLYHAWDPILGGYCHPSRASPGPGRARESKPYRLCRTCAKGVAA